MKTVFAALAALGLALSLSPAASAQHVDSKAWSDNSRTALIQLIKDKGYNSAAGQYVDTAALRQGKQYHVNLRLQGGRAYALLGVCGIMCGDLQVDFYENGVEIKHNWDGPQPFMEFTPPSDGIYEVGITMGRCNAPSSDYECPGAFVLAPKEASRPAEHELQQIKVTSLKDWQTPLRSGLLSAMNKRGYASVAGYIQYERAVPSYENRTIQAEVDAGQKYLLQGYCPQAYVCGVEAYDASGAKIATNNTEKTPSAEFTAQASGTYTLKLLVGSCDGVDRLCDVGLSLVFDPAVKPVAVAAPKTAAAEPKIDQYSLDMAENDLDNLMKSYASARIGNPGVSSLQAGYQMSGNIATKAEQPLSFRAVCGLDCTNIGLTVKDMATGKVLGEEKGREDALVVLQPGHPANVTFIVQMLKCDAPVCAYAVGQYGVIAKREENAKATLFGVAPDKTAKADPSKADAKPPQTDYSKYLDQYGKLTPKLGDDVMKAVTEQNKKDAAAAKTDDKFKSDPLTTYLDNNASYGWSRAGNVDIQDLKDLKTHTFRFKVDQNKPVTIYGVCEHGCKDLSFEARDTFDNVLDTAMVISSEPVLHIKAGQAFEIVVKASAKACTADPCRFGVGAYQK